MPDRLPQFLTDYGLSMGEFIGTVVGTLGVIGTAIAGAVTWLFKLDGRVTALEVDARRNDELHERLEQKMDKLIEHLIGRK